MEVPVHFHESNNTLVVVKIYFHGPDVKPVDGNIHSLLSKLIQNINHNVVAPRAHGKYPGASFQARTWHRPLRVYRHCYGAYYDVGVDGVSLWWHLLRLLVLFRAETHPLPVFIPFSLLLRLALFPLLPFSLGRLLLCGSHFKVQSLTRLAFSAVSFPNRNHFPARNNRVCVACETSIKRRELLLLCCCCWRVRRFRENVSTKKPIGLRGSPKPKIVGISLSWCNVLRCVGLFIG